MAITEEKGSVTETVPRQGEAAPFFTARNIMLYGGIAAVSVVAPILWPAYMVQMTVLWLMITFALTWDILGGQMGYNSLGNIFFFGAGMYVSAVVQIGLFFPVGEYTYAAGLNTFTFTETQYYIGYFAGLAAAGVLSSLFAIVFGWIVFGLRGPYFAIGTLGVAIAAGELVGAWNWIGGGSGISMPRYPGDPLTAKYFFYIQNFILAIATFWFCKWLYSTRFGLALNAIRDDEEKAEGMGIHTLRYKTVAWSISAFFLGISGAIFGNMIGFVEPLNVAFPTITFGIFMVVMVLLGGKGTLWGPVIGAVVFHVIKEMTWTYLLEWQWVALGLLIVTIVVYFQDGLMGWLMTQKPEWFGIRVERKTEADAGAAE